jgi:aminoglycoside phosphotransferase (APT) family kinase protein
MKDSIADDMQSHLQAYYAHTFPSRQGMQVSEVANISTGWESEMYAFDVEYGPVGQHQREELILRIYVGDDAHPKSAREFHGMRRLYRAGYPVPQVLALERENSPFGQPFVIMKRIEGQQLWPLLFDSPEERQQELLTLFCELFVRLHALEWRPFVDDVTRYDATDPYTFADRWLEEARLALVDLSIPGFLPIIEWLEVRRDQVPCMQPSPIHQDYHPGNVLLRDDGSAVVVDWTQVDIADSRSDLAWTLVLVSSYEGLEWRERILREYERLAGGRVEQIEYFEVSACAKRVASVAVSLLYGPEKLGMRPEAATVMKQQMRSIKAVYELLLERTGIRVAEVERMLESFP